MKLANRCADWDPQRFLREESLRSLEKQKLRSYLVAERGVQAGEDDTKRSTLQAERRQDAENLARDIETQKRREEADHEQFLRNRDTLRKSIDAHVAEQTQHRREQQFQDAKEAADMKMRTMRQLCGEMRERGRRREMLESNGREIMDHIKANAWRRQNDKDTADTDAREKMRRDIAADEKRLSVTNDLIKAKQARMQASADNYNRTAGAQNEQREKAERDRQDLDVARHTLRMDMFYASREQARERERQQMIKELNSQHELNESRRLQAKQDTRDDGDALMAANRRHIETEFQKSRDARTLALQIQAENTAMVEEKHRREGTVGYRRPAATATMAPPPTGDTREKRLMATVDAARHLDKPLGRPRPASSGAKGQGHKQPLPHSTALIARDHRLAASWYEGLTREEFRAGRAAAKRREEASALSRANA